MARTLTNEIIDAAIAGFEAQKLRIDSQIAELRSMRSGSGGGSPSKADTTPRKRKFSPDAIRRMREAQQRRWAKVRGEAGLSTPGASAAPRKRQLSAEGRKAIQEAVRRRWARKRAAAAKPKPATKNTAPKKATKVATTAGTRVPKKKAA